MKFDLGRRRLTSADGSGVTTTRAPRPEDLQALGAEVFRHLMVYGNVFARRTEAGEIEIVDPTTLKVDAPNPPTPLGSIHPEVMVAVLVAWGMGDDDLIDILHRIDKEARRS